MRFSLTFAIAVCAPLLALAAPIPIPEPQQGDSKASKFPVTGWKRKDSKTEFGVPEWKRVEAKPDYHYNEWKRGNQDTTGPNEDFPTTPWKA